MSDATVLYTPGTLVWCKLVDRIWWPGIIVDPSTTPDEFKEFLSRKKVPYVVYFERDNKYEPVINKKDIYLYSCSKKIEFTKRGYVSYKKQEESGKSGRINMDNFVIDVLNFENKINGDVNIFNQFDEEKKINRQYQMLVKDLFPTRKQQQKKKSKNAIKSRQSLPSLNTPKNLRVSLNSQARLTPKITKLAPNPIQEKEFRCYSQTGCTFKTNLYENLKKHIAEHKLEKNNQPLALFCPSNKRRNRKYRKYVTKKGKFEDELFKDVNIGDDEESSENIDNEKDSDDDKNTVDDKHDPQGSKITGNENAKNKEDSSDIHRDKFSIAKKGQFEDELSKDENIGDDEESSENIDNEKDNDDDKNTVDDKHDPQGSKIAGNENAKNKEDSSDIHRDKFSIAKKGQFEDELSKDENIGDDEESSENIDNEKDNDDDKNTVDDKHDPQGSKIAGNENAKNKEDSSDVNTDKEEECLLDSLTPLPDWSKTWENTSDANNENHKKIREYMTVDRKKQLECFNTDLLEPKPFTAPFEATVVHKLTEYQRLCENTIRLTIAYNDETDGRSESEVLADENVQNLIQRAIAGEKLTLGIVNARIVSIDKGD